jgi:rhodanese-related sulfurtransferase
MGERPTSLAQQPQQPRQAAPSPQPAKPAEGGTPPVAHTDPRQGQAGGSDNPRTTGQEPGPVAKGETTGPAAAPAPTQPSGMEQYMISLARAKELYDLKAKGQWDGIFIDARGYDVYLQGHIPGSMHIDKKYFDGAVPKKVMLYLPGSEVVVYCQGEQCTDSEAVAVRLQALKLNIGPIHIIREGYPGWAAAGYPVTKNGEGEVGFDEK